jgi:hypothetical protein
MTRFGYAALLLCFAGAAAAQTGPAGQGGGEIGEQSSQGTDADVRHGAGDPRAVMVPLYPGAPIPAVLDALIQKGFKIKWNAEEVLPTMTILERPKATRIDNVLNEILKPWGMRADHNMVDGGYRVRPLKKKDKK